MDNDDRRERLPERGGAADGQATRNAQIAAVADQTLSDRDQSSSDSDQSFSDADQVDSARDQVASDPDQATSDRARAAQTSRTDADETAYLSSRDEREAASQERFLNRDERAGTAVYRDTVADERDRTAAERDEYSRARNTLLPGATEAERRLVDELDQVRAAAAVDRARAAADRAAAARERARLEAELRTAHLDSLTGALRRDAGRLSIAQEIDRARRADGRFVIAFIDVDRLKRVNDRHGHAAGDLVLQTVVREVRTRLRPFDTIFRYGGDEFVCGLGGSDLDDVRPRFAAITSAIEKEAGVTISVGLAALAKGDTPDQLIARADTEMMRAKARHRSEE